MPDMMTMLAAHLEKTAASLGMRDCLIMFSMVMLGILFFFSRVGGWHELAKHYPAPKRYGGAWISNEVHFGNTSGDSIQVGADSQGLYLSIWIGLRPFHPPLFVPWSDVTAVGYQSVPWNKKNTGVRITFALGPVIALEIDTGSAKEIEGWSEGQWRMPQLD